MSAATIVAAVAVPTVASAVNSEAAAAPESTSVVEDFSYPGAANIPNITLIKGDGNITMVACDAANPDLITVESIGRTTFCFAVRGDTGWLSLRLDRVFLIGAGDQDVAAKVTVDGVAETVNIDEGAVAPIGASDPDFGVLLELRAH